ncbi:MAG: hypothetical protein RL593_472, partial [Pseudomonadota bacterium]
MDVAKMADTMKMRAQLKRGVTEVKV